MLPSREIAVVLLGVLVRGILLSLGEVASPRVVDGSMAGLLALGEVTAVLLLDGLSLGFLARREAAVLGVVAVVVVLAMIMVVVMVMVMVMMTVIVVGSFAHARVSQAMRVPSLWTAGQAAAAGFQRVAARR